MLRKYCQSLVLNSNDFANAIQAAQIGILAPYGYASCFRRRMPEHLALTPSDLDAIKSNGIGLFKPTAQKAANKIFQMMEERKISAAHAFHTDDHQFWFVFYFDQRDMSDDNHWQHGAHIHLVSHHWANLRLGQVWQQIQNGATTFAGIHLRYYEPDLPNEHEGEGEFLFDPCIRSRLRMDQRAGSLSRSPKAAAKRSTAKPLNCSGWRLSDWAGGRAKPACRAERTAVLRCVVDRIEVARWSSRGRPNSPPTSSSPGPWSSRRAGSSSTTAASSPWRPSVRIMPS